MIPLPEQPSSLDERMDSPDLHELLLQLREARCGPYTLLEFKDGRVLGGAITFVERLGTGRLINVEAERVDDFNVYELKSVVY